MNQFSINETFADWSSTVEMREDLMRSNEMRYAIFDFNLSILMPPDTSIESCRLPHQETFYGAYCQPPDVSQGEYEYNPFAFDIGSLGILFCDMFQVCCSPCYRPYSLRIVIFLSIGPQHCRS